MKNIYVVNLKKNKKLKKLIMKLLHPACCWNRFYGSLCGQLFAVCFVRAIGEINMS